MILLGLEMAWVRVRGTSALVEDPYSISNIHMWLTAASNSRSRGPDSSLDSVITAHTGTLIFL